MVAAFIGFLAFVALAIYEINTSQQSGSTGILQQVGATVSSIVSGGNLSASQIAQYAAAAGFTGDDLATAIAIAMAESGGNPKAYNPETAARTPVGQGSFGLWQIYLKAHPEFAGVDLTDPQTNANAAFSVYQAAGNRFTPWSTFGNGAYASYLSQAQGAINV
ncbi:MAG: transglycosylase SLT domain-containing protein [Candidatus Limnocylindrales bacterium]